MTFLQGKKTYIFAFLGACVAGSVLMGWLDLDTANVLMGLLGFGGLASLRASK